jgi:hypothetical protein
MFMALASSESMALLASGAIVPASGIVSSTDIVSVGVVSAATVAGGLAVVAAKEPVWPLL